MATMYDNIYDTVFRPQAAMVRLGVEKPLGQALIALLIGTVLPAVVLYGSLQHSDWLPAGSLLLALQLMGTFVGWLLTAAIWQLSAECLGGTGSALGLLTALGFAQLVRMFCVPFWVLSALLPEAVRPVASTLIVVGMSSWSVWLDWQAVRGVHRLSGAKATLAMLLPFVGIGVLLALAIVLMGTALLPWWPDI